MHSPYFSVALCCGHVKFNTVDQLEVAESVQGVTICAISEGRAPLWLFPSGCCGAAAGSRAVAVDRVDVCLHTLMDMHTELIAVPHASLSKKPKENRVGKMKRFKS